MSTILKASKTVHKVLVKRLEETGKTQAEICEEANELKCKITVSQLCNYIKNHGEKKYSLTETQLIWLCTRYGIELNLHVGKPHLIGDEIAYKVGEYNEGACLEKIKKIF